MIDVLVVDDDFMVARIHRGFVERTPGFRVVGVAHTAREAFEAVAALEPDLVLLDIYLPDLSGLDVLERLRADWPEVDVLAISAARESETVRRAVRGGVVHYLMKPFGYEVLRERLDHYATAHRGLLSAPVADQADVDRLFGVRPAGAPAQVPKGLSPETARLVEAALREAAASAPPGEGRRSRSAAECAAAVGISRVSARRYLEHFVGTGAAEVRLRYGSAGRPERRYVWVRP
ncbi:MAG: response regulator [Actinobacteria bacterium]|nr:response regulator [Actinomycetota bacterium]